MDPFALRKLGRSDVMLPQMGFGGAPLGDLFVALSEADAEATLAAAWEQGVRFYDTSPWYGRGQSEHRLGRALYRQPREQVILSTKVGRILRTPINDADFAVSRKKFGWAGGLEFEHYYDYSYSGIMRSYEDSLQRLGMNRIDILIIHDLDLSNHGSEQRVSAHLDQLCTSGFRALAELKATGRIGAIGAGINHLGTIPRFVDLFDLDFFLVASPYTLGEQETLDVEIPMCVERGIGMVIGAVFNSGLYATGPIPGARYNYREPTEAQLDKVRRIQAVCTRHGVPLAAAAMQFPLHHPAVASIIPGAFHPDHIKRNVETMRIDIPDALWHELKAENLIRADAPTP